MAFTVNLFGISFSSVKLTLIAWASVISVCALTMIKPTNKNKHHAFVNISSIILNFTAEFRICYTFGLLKTISPYVACLHIRSMIFSPGSTKSLPCCTASGDNCTSSICPNTVVTYTCTIISGTAGGLTDWTLPTGTCLSNTFPDKIRLSQFVSGSCSAQGQIGISMCEPYRASSIQSSDPIYCLSTILTVSITAAMNGSTVMCSNTNLFNTSITAVVSLTTINVVGMLLFVGLIISYSSNPYHRTLSLFFQLFITSVVECNSIIYRMPFSCIVGN